MERDEDDSFCTEEEPKEVLNDDERKLLGRKPIITGNNKDWIEQSIR